MYRGEGGGHSNRILWDGHRSASVRLTTGDLKEMITTESLSYSHIHLVLPGGRVYVEYCPSRGRQGCGTCWIEAGAGGGLQQQTAASLVRRVSLLH